MYVIGLTGGIAAGKTTVAKILETKNAVVLNADEIARQIVKPHSKAWNRIVHHFGRDVLMADDTINRRALAKAIFFEPALRRLLDEITHPEIIEVMKKKLQKIDEDCSSRDSFVVLDVPLLIEAGLTHMTDYILAVEADDDIRISRLEELGLSFAESLARMEAQISVFERGRFADFVIQNNGTLEELQAEVERYFKHLTEELAPSRRAAR